MSSDLVGFIISIILGWVAFLFGIAGCVPQSIKVFKTKDTQSISLSMYIIYCIGCVAWVIWSIGYTYEAFLNLNNGSFTNDVSPTVILFANLPTLVLNVVCLGLALVILIIKIKNLIGSKKLKISEREYTERTIKQREEKKQ